MTKIYGYKALDENMRAIHGNGMTYELGKWYKIEGDLVPCKNGFHFCKYKEDVNYWYDLFGTNNRIFKVEVRGNVVDCDNGKKSVASEIRIVKELNKERFLSLKSIQLEAVKNNGYTIEYINNPSEKVQLEAVKQNGYAIEYIDNPSKKVQLEAVKEDGRAIQYIENPTSEMQLEAVKSCGKAIRFIEPEFQTFEIQKEAIKQNPSNIFYIQNPFEEVQLEAIKHNIPLSYIKNPTDNAIRLYEKLVLLKRLGLNIIKLILCWMLYLMLRIVVSQISG